jgi:hypothetical protein
MAFREIENLMPMKEPADKTRMFQTLMKGLALFYVENHLIGILEVEDSDVSINERIELVLRDVGSEYIPKPAIHMQKYYMRQTRSLYMVLDTSVQQFVERLNDLNRYLLYQRYSDVCLKNGMWRKIWIRDVEEILMMLKR